MGNKAAKHKVTSEDMEFLMKHVQDPSGTEAGKSTFYRLNFTDSGHTKARIQVLTQAGNFRPSYMPVSTEVYTAMTS